LIIDGTADFNKKIADLVNYILVSTLRNGFQEFSLDEVLSIWGKSLPQVLIISLVSNILRIDRSIRNVSSEDDSSEGLNISSVYRYVLIKYQKHSYAVELWIRGSKHIYRARLT